MISILIEMVAIFNIESIYSQIRTALADKVNLQVSYPNIPETPEFELNFFAGNIDDRYYVKAGIVLPESFEEFRQSIISEDTLELEFKTDALGIVAVRVLAESFFKNDPFPSEWRKISNYLVFN